MESLGRRAWRMRVGPTLRDPWTLLVCVFGGGAAWALFDGSVALGTGVGAGMLATAAVASVFRAPPTVEAVESLPELRRGSEQAHLVGALDDYLGELRRLRSARLPPSLTSSAIEALVAADGARSVALHVAAAVDALDDAIARASRVAGSGPMPASDAVRSSIGRMTQRREDLLVKLREAVGGVSEVYTKLLELSATVDLAALPSGSEPGSVGEVNASLDALRGTFAELDAQARTARELA